MRMDRRREGIKLVVGVLGAAILLMAVLLLGSAVNPYLEGNDKVQTQNGQENYSVVSSGQTVWDYLETGKEPAADGEGRTWLEQGYEGEGWKSASGTFGSVKGERTDRVANKLPRNLLAFYQEDGTLVPAYYFRTEFEVEDPKAVQKLQGEIQYDDAVIVYLNGEVLYEGNVPEHGYAESLYGSEQVADRSLNDKIAITDTSKLKKGTNVLCVELHQSSPGSTDIYFDFKNLVCVKGGVEEGALDVSGLILEPGQNERELKVNWLSRERGAYVVQVSKTAGNQKQNAYTDYEMEEIYDTGQGYYCYTGTISGLMPDTDYSYRIASQDVSRTSEIFKFRTASWTEGFSFLFAGDPQLGAGELTADKEGWERILESGNYIDPSAAFLISAGDQIDSSNEEDALQEYLALRSPAALKSLPLYVNRGNHEAGTELFDGQFGAGTTKQHDSSRVYGNTLFISLNSNNDNFEEHRDFVRKVTEQYPSKWVIVTMHYPMYGARLRGETLDERRKEYSEIFAEFGVDLVLSGHDHLYTRSCIMKGSEAQEKSGGLLEKGETLYLSAGSSTGSKYYTKYLEQPAFTEVMLQEETPFLTDIKVEENKITIRTYKASTMEIADSVVLLKE